jgi:hypothetical protein
LIAACNGPSRKTPILDTGDSLGVGAVSQVARKYARRPYSEFRPVFRHYCGGALNETAMLGLPEAG